MVKITFIRSCLFISLLVLLHGSLYARKKVLYVSTQGDNDYPGTSEQPLKSVSKAIREIRPGGTVYLKGGTYWFSSTLTIANSGASFSITRLMTMPGEQVIFDFSEQDVDKYARGIELKASFWHLKGFTVSGAGDNGILVSGRGNKIENITLCSNADSGLQLRTGAMENLILNCDSFHNCDPHNKGENADGFAAKFGVGRDNIFRGCRSWANSDDGWDLWKAGNGVKLEFCYSYSNGYNLWKIDGYSGDGNGFKLGQGRGKHYLLRSMAWDNAARGFDVNGNQSGVTVINCTSYRNGHKNFYFDDNNPHVLRNCLSFIGEDEIWEEIDDKDNSWNLDIKLCDELFISLDPVILAGTRLPDGRLKAGGFLLPTTESGLLDAGRKFMNLPFRGNAPALGCFE